MSGSGGSCEEAKHIDVMVPAKSVVEHDAESIRRLLNLQASISGHLAVQDASWTVNCINLVYDSPENNSFLSSWLNRDSPLSLLYRFLH